MKLQADKLSRREESDHIPLSFAQQRLWLLDQFEPGNPVYNIPFAVHLAGLLDVTALEMSINEIIHRHEALRTTFSTVQGEPVQVILPAPHLKLPLTDLRELPKFRQEKELRKVTKRVARRPFDMTKDLLLQAVLVRLDEKKHVLLLTIHHIVADGWSMGVLFRELSILYKSFCSGEPSPLPELPIQYADFTVWQRLWMQGEVLVDQLSYWKEQLDRAPPFLGLPADYPRPAAQTFRGAHHSLILPLSLTAALQALSLREGVTLFMLLLAGFKLLLYRYTGQEDVIIGSHVANRKRIEIEKLIGLFVNTLVLRTDMSGNPTFREMLVRVREMCLGAYDHQDLPFAKLVEELQPDRTQSHSPLFQVMFNLQNAPPSLLESFGLSLKPLEVDSGTSKFDLTLTMAEEAEGLRGVLEYDIDLFNKSTIERMARNFQTILEGIVADPDQHLSGFSLLGQAERHQLLIEWNNTKTDYPRNKCIHHLFEEQVERTPDAVAVVFADQQLTYRELNGRANQLAHYLIDSGVGPDVLVGLFVDRSIDMMVGLLGILKAGGGYVPLDPAYPKERLSYMLEESKSPVLITQSKFKSDLPPSEARVVFIDSDWDNISRNGIEPPGLHSELGIPGPENLAYVIFTSGSTGMPKGVEISHRSICNHMAWICCNYSISTEDFVLQRTPFSFDASVWEFFAPLMVGGRLIMAQPMKQPDSNHLINEITKHNVTIFQLVPSLLRVLLDDPNFIKCSSLRHIFCGGELLTDKLQNRLLTLLPWVVLHNLYGPTEATIDVLSWTCLKASSSDNVPIGRPIYNTEVYIVDSSIRLVPIGGKGELLIGGDCLARGYLNRPELTKEKFIPDPFSDEPGARLYRTGDLARYRSDGNIEFLGRIDHQVKIRGFRIELGEIEAVLNSHPSVSDSVVVVHEEDTGDKRLVAYLVYGSASAPTVTELRRFLGDKLPGYMIPSLFVTLDTLPLTPSGKVDRRALPAPDYKRPDLGERHVAPRTRIEEDLAAIWTELLRIEQLGVNDDFFALGGHSLLATQVMSQVRQVFSVDLPLRSLFETPTVAGLAENLQLCLQSEQPKTTAIEKVSRDGNSPLSFAQQRLWFLDRLIPDSAVYNVPEAYSVVGPLDIEVLKRSLNEIVRRHEALRTIFVDEEGGPVQRVTPFFSLELPVIDLQDLPGEEKQTERNRLIEEEACRPFDLTRGPLLKAKLLRLDQQDHVLLVVMHHIITDGWSMGVFFHEFALLYQTYSNGKDSPLPELPIQYADFAVWQRQQIQGEGLTRALNYWKNQLDGVTVLELPTDRPRPPMQTYRGSQESFVISQPLTEALGALGRTEQVTLFMTLLAAFQTLLSRYTGQEDIAVGSPIANRSRIEIEKLIGFFVNTLVLRSDLSGDPTFRDLLKRVRETALEAYFHQDLPFEQLVKELQPERNPSFSPLFQVMFVLQNVPVEKQQLPELTMEAFAVATRTAKFDLTLSLTEREGELQGIWEYNTDLFDRATITRMTGHLHTLLEGIVASPDQHLSEFTLLTEAERHQLLVEWNTTKADYSRDACIHGVFDAQVEQTPDAVAVVFADQQLTYRELNGRANQLAHYLQKLGVGPEVFVGICMERSLEMVVGLLGILKAGGVYVPLDPEYPGERLSFMAKDAGIQLLLTSSGMVALLPELDVPLIYLDAEEKISSRGYETCLPTGVIPGHPAYVMYTSGSTGMPKGIEVTHRNVIRLVKNTNYVVLDSSTTLLHYAPLSFDASTFEIWGALLNGGKLVVCPPGRLTLNELGLLLEANQVTTLWLTAALFHAVVENNPEVLLPVRQLLAGGDVLSASAVKKVFQGRHDITLVNGYGPTENTTFTCCYLMVDPSQVGEKVLIGKPIANTSVYILDKSMQPVPIGVIGELYAGGDGVARGYINRPELTAEKFIPDPFSDEPGARLYRSGDLARYRPDGNIEFLGRIDHQVKIHGFRIELGEIEAVLNSHPSVSDSVVVVQEEDTGDKRLVAYLVYGSDSAPTVTELRRFLGEKLPGYMLPSLFVTLDTMPLTPSGKVDRRALPAPDYKRPDLAERNLAPRTPIEVALAAIWADLLGLEQVGVHDNFFELGGFSLLAVRLIDRIYQQFSRRLSIVSLFQGATIAQLAAILEEESSPIVQSSIIPIQPFGAEVPLFFLHSLGEGVFFPRKLMQHLGGSHPVYCFQAIGEEVSLQTNKSIESMAERYAEDLIRYYPKLPYCLIGYSFGGFLAYEVAQQLHLKNKKVALLAIIDTGPFPRQPRTKIEKMQYVARVANNLPRWVHDALIHRDNKELADRIRTKLKTTKKRINNIISHKQGLSVQERLEDIFELDQLSPRHRALMEIHYQALAEYEPKPYPGRTTLFRALTRPPFHSLKWDLGWDDLTVGGLDIKAVPGTHESIINEPNVMILANRLRECLAQVEYGTRSIEPEN